jgi:hypothetical protein
MGLLDEIRSRKGARQSAGFDEAAAKQHVIPQPRPALRAIDNLAASVKADAPRPRTVACGAWRPVRFERNAWPSELHVGEGTLDSLAQSCRECPAQTPATMPTDQLIRAHQEKLLRSSPRHKHYSRFCRDRCAAPHAPRLSPPSVGVISMLPHLRTRWLGANRRRTGEVDRLCLGGQGGVVVPRGHDSLAARQRGFDPRIQVWRWRWGHSCMELRLRDRGGAARPTECACVRVGKPHTRNHPRARTSRVSGGVFAAGELGTVARCRLPRRAAPRPRDRQQARLRVRTLCATYVPATSAP